MTDLRLTVQALWNGEVLWSCPMARYSTLRVGGPAAAVIEPRCMTELASLIRGFRANKVDWLVVGGGSNILVREQGFAGF